MCSDLSSTACLDSLGVISDDVTTSCCPDDAACPEGVPTSCNSNCAGILEPFFERCSSWVKRNDDFAALVPVIDMCEETIYGSYTGVSPKIQQSDTAT